LITTLHPFYYINCSREGGWKRGMEKGSGCKGKGDGEGELMYREGGWGRGADV
jgi:hypothetical protein